MPEHDEPLEMVTGREPPPFPPSRIRLGHTGIEWNVGEPMPKAAKRYLIMERVVFGLLMVSVVLLFGALFGLPLAITNGWTPGG